MALQEQTPAQRAAPPGARPPQYNLAELERELKAHLEGEVRFDAASPALYATDSSNFRQTPFGVVVPRTRGDMVRTVNLCRRHGAPVLLRGGGTSLAGQCCNVAVVIDTSKYLRGILELDARRRRARVQPGVVLDDLRNAAEKHHLTKELERIIAAGGRRDEIYAGLRGLRDRYGDLIRRRYPQITRRISGYNLDQLLPEHGFHVARALVGSESTCVTVLEAVCRLVPSPPARVVAVLGYGDIYTAGDHAAALARQHDAIACEGLDDRLVALVHKKPNLHPETARLLPPGKGWLVVELGAGTASAAQAAERLIATLPRFGAPQHRLYTDRERQEGIWKLRESGLGATAFVPGQPLAWEGWEDAAVPPERLGDYLRAFRKLLDEYGYNCPLYGHFGQGCMHTRIDFDLFTAGGVARYREFLHAAARLVAGFGGSLSGEHGDGQTRGELLRAFREFKTTWDPDWRMNPNKVPVARRSDQDLRLADYHPWQPATHFKFLDKMLNLLPERAEARQLAGRTFLLSEWLEREAPDLALPPLRRRALAQIHCHQRGLTKADAGMHALERMQLEAEPLTMGCCGMAGSFGYEAKHYDISMQIGELGALPRAREAPRDALIVADGFSCREQIGPNSGRKVMHLAMHPAGRAGCEVGAGPWLSHGAKTALGVGAALAAAGLAWRGSGEKKTA